MARKVYVTPAQKTAAQLAVKRAKSSGKTVSSSVTKIAEAKPTNGRWTQARPRAGQSPR